VLFELPLRIAGQHACSQPVASPQVGLFTEKSVPASIAVRL
jgi:hypothetical protein